MEFPKSIYILTKFLVCFSFMSFSLADHHQPLSLTQLVQDVHRSAENISRNKFRHPVETLEFFGLKPNMTVIEILPSSGWYTEVIAPFLRDEGKYYAAHFSPNAQLAYMPRRLREFEEKITSDPNLYGKITVRHLNPPHEVIIAPPESADMALTFRNVHNWIMADQQHEFFDSFFSALKPGGILGIVEHRALPDATMEAMRTTGYVTEAYVTELAVAAGFEFLESTQINSNPKDSTVHPEGVWTLPPNFRAGDIEREKYAAVGESDRMTLKFRKPLD
jgi:predicted methyltransferase